MLKQTIKTIIKIFSAILAFVAFVVMVLFLWIYTGPRSVPFLADYLRENVSELLPRTISIYVNDTLIAFDDEFRLQLKLDGFKVIDDTRGEFSTSDISVIVDPLAFFPQTHRNLLNIQINSPGMAYNAIKTQIDDDTLPLQQINDYLNAHKETLLKFSLSLTNTNFDFDITDSRKAAVNINEVILRPTLVRDKLLFALYGDLNIGGKNNVLEATVDTSSDEYLVIKGTVTNLSNYTLSEFGVDLPAMENANIELDVTFNALLKGTRHIEKLEFNGSNFDGMIRANSFFNNDIKISDLKLHGYCTSNCESIIIDKLNIKADKFALNSTLEYKTSAKEPTLNINFALSPTTVSMVNYHWPKTAIPRTRDWIFEHIVGGNVKSAKGALNFKMKELQNKKLVDSKIDIGIDLQGTSFKYMDEVDAIKNIDAHISITQDDIKFDISKGTLSKSNIVTASGVINDLGSSKSIVKVTGEVKGDAQDLIDIGMQHANKRQHDLKGLSGKADTKVSVIVPLQDEDLEIKDLKIVGSSKITDAAAKGLYKDFTLSGGHFDVDFANFIVDVKGSGLINHKYKSDISAQVKVLEDYQNIKVRTKMDWDNIASLGLTKPDFINNSFDLVLELTEKKGERSRTFAVDLTNSTINHSLTGIKKKMGEPAFLRVMADETDDGVFVKDYFLSLPNVESKGDMMLSKDYSLHKISSPMTKIGRGQFRLDYTNNNNINNITISGDSIDLSEANLFDLSGGDDKNSNNQSQSNKPGYQVSVNVAAMYMQNDQIIYKPQLNMDYSKGQINKLRFIGNFKDGGNFDFNIKYPVLSIVSSNAGSFAKAFGLTNKIIGGDLNLNGQLSGKNFDGILDIRDYKMRKVPVMAKILSVVSITTSLDGLANVLTDSGVQFDKLKCPLNLKNGVMTLNDCYTKGPSLTITGRGTVDFDRDTINMKGTVIPENILQTAIRNIPIIGEAFKGSKDHAILGTSYSVSGSLSDPKVSSNPLSILAPGVLKDIF